MGRSFIGLSYEFGKKKSFFVMNQPPGTVGTLLKRHVDHWEHSIVPPFVTDVGRFIGNLQTLSRTSKRSKFLRCGVRITAGKTTACPGRGRDIGCPIPPAQIPTCGITA
jgi:hypothetical protein